MFFVNKKKKKIDITRQCFDMPSIFLVQSSYGVPTLVWQLIETVFNHENADLIFKPEKKVKFCYKSQTARRARSELTQTYECILGIDQAVFQFIYKRFQMLQ